MNLPLRTITIDDEQLALNRLKRLLSDYADVFDIIAEGHNGAEGLDLIEKHKPDLVFLDIEMPLLNGFEMLAKVSTMPMVVFATAYDQYAIRAFEENSVDYLLKPIENERLQKTIEKIKSRVEVKKTPQTDVSAPEDTREHYTQNLLRLLERMQPRQEMHALSVKSGERILLIPLTEVSHFEAEDKYVFLNTLDGHQYLVSHTLTSLEEKLPVHFLRVSRSAILNTHQINEIQRYFNGKYMIVMRDRKASSLQSGSTYGDAIRQLLSI
ncbi:LytR/AlgR family response regulator transcription factor [Persicitalea jodogahamensis]|uniref:DNA-binding response regulator n=1 Tax=Persicitalea jodogahamensis TaxID=402147 RepID=A0A8J3D509_9BACT|nr:LytTR family DNA-binding domain-containing protein [Persicitalea jodogahamensis]GHB84055.1 DNA-binding response regulator [Persicitalea jodogahamensis]